MILQALLRTDPVFVTIYYPSSHSGSIIRIEQGKLYDALPAAKLKKDGSPHANALRELVSVKIENHADSNRQRQNLFATRQEAVTDLIRQIDEHAAKDRAAAEALA